MINVSWEMFKDFLNTRGVFPQSFSDSNSYVLVAIDGTLAITTTLPKSTTNKNTKDYLDNYASSANKKILKADSDNVALSRTKVTASGWHFQMYGLEFETSKLSSVIDLDVYGNVFGNASIKFYDDNDTELTTQVGITASCEKRS